ncbi:LysR family transcriptional regulator [Paremcibacter congregatus]|uniref:LysR family transcriptional regulator n=1 Tax=Paremcibacter congregatus TaxID=2043170 RepID=UPI0030ED8CB0|tara:strand:+ start:6860 stop:7759 length:900 start_codon:yes stop_codon:yes gene_type:complete
MQMKQIEVFHAVYSTGSVSNAAKFLHVSQPAVSKVLHRAEDQLGYLLFKRVKGKLVPTDEAHSLFAEVSQVYQQILSLQKKARNLKSGAAGHIRLSVMPALGLNVLPLSIARFLEDHPGVTFDIQTRHYDDMIRSLYEHEIDIGLAFNPDNHVGLARYEFGQGEFVCVHNPESFPKNPDRLGLAELEGKNIISIKDSGPLSDLLFQRILQEGVSTDSAITVQTYYIAKNLVGYGMGMAIVDQLTAQAEGPGKTSFKGFTPPITYAVTGLYAESRPLSNVCQNFLGYLKQVYEELVQPAK